MVITLKQDLKIHTFKTIDDSVIPQPPVKNKRTRLTELPILANFASSLNSLLKPKTRLSKKKEEEKKVMVMPPPWHKIWSDIGSALGRHRIWTTSFLGSIWPDTVGSDHASLDMVTTSYSPWISN